MITVYALAFAVGVWLLQCLPVLPHLTWAVLSFIPLVTVFAANWLKLPYLKPIGLLIFSASLGFFWALGFAHFRLSDTLPHEWEGKKVTLAGVVASMPQQMERGDRFEFDVERVLTEDAPIPTHISLSQYSYEKFGDQNPGSRKADSSRGATSQKLTFHAGERWQLTVKLKRPHGTANPHGFDFEAWALERNIRATGNIQKDVDNQLISHLVIRPHYLIERLRERIRERMQEVLQDKPYGGVLVALATGDENAISSNDWQLFQRTGTSHLMSISGLHITMLSGMLAALVYAVWRRVPALLGRLPARKAAVVAGVLTALLYSLFSGFSVPAQRTLYMLLVFACALWAGRQVSLSRVLAYALLVVLVFDPWAVLAPGFWLSFGAVAVMAYAMNGRLARPHWLKEAITGQCAVTLGTLPLLLILFQQVSVISPVANALAIPLVSLVVVPLTLLGSILPFDGLLQLAHVVMVGCMDFLVWIAGFPLATWQQHAPPLWTMPFALLGVLWMLLPKGFPMRWLGLCGLLPMLLVTPLLPQTGAMKVAVLDVGQGLAVIVQTKHHQLLYDTGPKYSSQSDSGSRIVVPYLRGEGLARLDGLIVSHNDTDHSGGMQSVLTQVPVNWIDTSLPKDAEELVGRTPTPCFAGQSWVWDEVKFQILYPELASYQDDTLKDNDRSCVLKVSSRYGSILLTGDIERHAERDLLDSMVDSLASDVLVVPHHGSKTSSTTDFVQAVHPATAIFTVGYRNRFGHPKQAVVDRYEAIGSRLYRSDMDGAVLIDFISDQGIAIKRWRSQYRRYWQDTEQ